MKKFKDCKIDDVVFIVVEGSCEIERAKVDVVSREKLTASPDNKAFTRRYINSMGKRWVKQSEPHGYRKEYIFTNKSDAIQYAKSNVMRELQMLINKANESLDKVEEFRIKHWEELNHDFLDPQIRKLQRRERESLYK